MSLLWWSYLGEICIPKNNKIYQVQPVQLFIFVYPEKGTNRLKKRALFVHKTLFNSNISGIYIAQNVREALP